MLRKYLPVFTALLLLHYLFSHWILIVAWCLLGIVFARWLTNTRRPLIAVVCMETLIGIIYWMFFWSRNESIYQLSARFNVPVIVWPLTAIAVNILTAFLCTASFYYLSKLRRA